MPIGHSSAPKKATGAVITDWQPEDPAFRQQHDQRIVNRNLWTSVPCLLLAFCVWILFSTVATSSLKVSFNFTTDQLSMLTALSSVSSALLRISCSFMVPIFGGHRWIALSTGIPIISCVRLGFVARDTSMPYSVSVVTSLLCDFADANSASSMANINFFFPKQKQGGTLDLSGSLDNMGVNAMRLVVPLVVSLSIFVIFDNRGVKQPDRIELYLVNAFWIWVPLLAVFIIAAWFGMNDLVTLKASIKEQSPILKWGHLQIIGLLYLTTFGSFIGFSAGFMVLSKAQSPDVRILQYVLFGPFTGTLARSAGSALSDRLGGTCVTLVNLVLMTVFSNLLSLTLLTDRQGGSFMAPSATFLALFLTAGLGSDSTLQMTFVIFRKLIMGCMKAEGGSDERAMHKAATDTAATLGFISATGVIGGFFVPRALGSSLTLTGSPVGAMKVFLIFYTVCVVVTWTVYGRHSKK